ncbi:MAG: ATP-binding protein [Ferruginibacter sp.]
MQNVSEMKADYENSLLQAQLEIQEQAFANISREIHDNIGQKLSLSKLYLTTLDFNDIEELKRKIDTVTGIIGFSIEGLSNITRSMSSEIVNANGLIGALQHEVNMLNRAGAIKANLEVSGQTLFLPTNKELLIFRIIQEAITNILKHAQASEVKIKMHYDIGGMLQVLVEDDGRGFANEAGQRAGIGLHNMEKRCRMLNGSFSCRSEPGLGTKIILQIPTDQDDAKL